MNGWQRIRRVTSKWSEWQWLIAADIFLVGYWLVIGFLISLLPRDIAMIVYAWLLFGLGLKAIQDG